MGNGRKVLDMGKGQPCPLPNPAWRKMSGSCGVEKKKKSRTYRNSSHPRKGRPLGFHFTREKEGHDMEACIGLITSTHTDVVT